MAAVPGGYASPTPAPAPKTPPTDPSFWPRVLEVASSVRRARIVLDGSTLGDIASEANGVRTARVRVAPELLAPARATTTEIESLVASVAGFSLKVEFFSDAPAPDSAAAAPRANVQDHPLVKAALDLFKGRVLSVQPRQPAES